MTIEEWRELERSSHASKHEYISLGIRVSVDSLYRDAGVPVVMDDLEGEV